MSETSVGATEPCDFEINNFCMVVGVIHDDGKSLGIVEEEERQNLNSVLKKKDEISGLRRKLIHS